MRLSYDNRSKQQKVGRKKVAREQTKCYKKNIKLQQEVWKLRKRIYRRHTSSLKSTPTKSPRSKVAKITEGRFVSEKVRKELFAGAILQEEVHAAVQNLGKKYSSEKKVFSKLFEGKILKKYRMLKHFQKILPLKAMKQARTAQVQSSNPFDYILRSSKISTARIKENVELFFLSDIASHETPGKRQFLKINDERYQIRYLKDTRNALYRKYLSTYPRAVSFTTFCRYCPPWVVTPKLSGRDTCLCIKCENIKLLVSALKCSEIIKECKPRQAHF